MIAGGTPLTHLNMAFFMHQQEMEITSVLQEFWEIETCGSETKREILIPKEELVIKRFKNSVQFKEGRYEVTMPWKSDAAELPDNYDMAVNR